MEILLAIDKVLALPFVRWVLLATTAACITYSTYSALRLTFSEAALARSNAKITELNAQVMDTNNKLLATEKLAEDAKKKLEAQAEANKKLASATADKVKKVMELEMKGSCQDMVAEALKAVRDAD